MAEDPKRFLREVKVGIGVPKTDEDGTQVIDFNDALDRACSCVMTRGEEMVVVLVTDGDGSRIVLTPGQAKRLANTLEHWAFAGNLGV